MANTDNKEVANSNKLKTNKERNSVSDICWSCRGIKAE